jgi:deazaflavin-dependent oxidoreductase (nitroreductase family)
MSTSPQDFNARIIEEFRANEGRVGGTFAGSTLLLLHHVGAKSGKARVNPLAYNRDGDRYVVFASKAGAPTNPDWYHNLKAHPDVTIEVGTDTIRVRAEEATGRGTGPAVPRPGRAFPAVRRIPEQDRTGDPGDRADANRLNSGFGSGRLFGGGSGRLDLCLAERPRRRLGRRRR